MAWNDPVKIKALLVRSCTLPGEESLCPSLGAQGGSCQTHGNEVPPATYPGFRISPPFAQSTSAGKKDQSGMLTPWMESHSFSIQCPKQVFLEKARIL